MSRKDDFADLTQEFEQLQKQYQELETQHEQTLKDLEIMTKSRETGWKYVRELEVIESQKKEQDLLIPQLKLEIEELKAKLDRARKKKNIEVKEAQLNIRIPVDLRSQMIEKHPRVSEYLRTLIQNDLNSTQSIQ